MDTASIQFIGFGLLAVLIINISKHPVWRSAVLLAFSLIFVVLLSPGLTALLPLAGFLLLGYVLINRRHRKATALVAPFVFVVILAYAWLKQYTFLPKSTFLTHPYLVLGLSYIFFRVLHLIIEAGDGTEGRSISFFSYLVYTLNFTTFICGPIQRYDDFSRDQFTSEPISLDLPVIGSQLERIVRGFIKVNVAAMILYSAQQDALASLAQPLPTSVKLFAGARAMVLYPFFLYCNFSGYIDIVIALGRLMRLRLPENFERPFAATSFIDFWSRWHITLSQWLKTYVYNPLLMALMRRIPSPSVAPYLGVFSFFVTFFLVGLWHGRTSEFIVFGILQGGGVAINKLWQVWLTQRLGRKRFKDLSGSFIYNSFSRGLTFTWFAFTLFWFWSRWKQLDFIFTSLSALQWIVVIASVWLVATVLLSAWEAARSLLLKPSNTDGPLLTSRYARVIYTSAFVLIAFVMSVLLNHPAPDLVYKAF